MIIISAFFQHFLPSFICFIFSSHSLSRISICGSQYVHISPSCRLLFIVFCCCCCVFLPFRLFSYFSSCVYMLCRMLFISSQLVSVIFPHQQNFFSPKSQLCLHFIFDFLNFLFLAEQKAIQIVFLIYSNNTCLFLTKRNKLYIFKKASDYSHLMSPCH